MIPVDTIALHRATVSCSSLTIGRELMMRHDIKKHSIGLALRNSIYSHNIYPL